MMIDSLSGFKHCVTFHAVQVSLVIAAMNVVLGFGCKHFLTFNTVESLAFVFHLYYGRPFTLSWISTHAISVMFAHSLKPILVYMTCHDVVFHIFVVFETFATVSTYNCFTSVVGMSYRKILNILVFRKVMLEEILKPHNHHHRVTLLLMTKKEA